jgi:hypothetical protein
MMKSLAICSMLLLSSCAIAPTYDPVEYARLAEIKVNALDMTSRCSVMTGQEIHDKLTIVTRMAIEQARYRKNTSELVKANQALLGMIDHLEASYAKEKPSPKYCVDKLHNISTGADRIMRVIAGLEK